ncbi:MAG: hypothetical protein LIO68_03555 [Rikenellaceae bacterium]|nr:hypothetical protein [Rikenellaceae bacterium]
MSPGGRKIVNVLLLVLLVAYTVVAVHYCSGRERELKCRGVEIVIRDSAQLRFVTPAIVRHWLADSGVRLNGVPLREVDVYAVERLVEGQDYVSRADAYTAIDGLLHIVLSQRRPVLRVVSESGHNFYLDSTLVLLPPQPDCIAEVPAVSGKLPLGFPADYFGRLDEKKFPRERELLHNLLNFVHQVDTDRFLAALTAQVYYDGKEVRLLPRVGGQTIRFGEIADSAAVAGRLRKLSRFYRKSFGEGWWRSATEIDLRFRGQVVCKGMPEAARPVGGGDKQTESTHEIYGQ